MTVRRLQVWYGAVVRLFVKERLWAFNIYRGLLPHTPGTHVHFRVCIFFSIKMQTMYPKSPIPPFPSLKKLFMLCRIKFVEVLIKAWESQGLGLQRLCNHERTTSETDLIMLQAAKRRKLKKRSIYGHDIHIWGFISRRLRPPRALPHPGKLWQNRVEDSEKRFWLICARYSPMKSDWEKTAPRAALVRTQWGAEEHNIYSIYIIPPCLASPFACCSIGSTRALWWKFSLFHFFHHSGRPLLSHSRTENSPFWQHPTYNHLRVGPLRAST